MTKELYFNPEIDKSYLVADIESYKINAVQNRLKVLNLHLSLDEIKMNVIKPTEDYFKTHEESIYLAGNPPTHIITFVTRKDSIFKDGKKIQILEIGYY